MDALRLGRSLRALRLRRRLRQVDLGRRSGMSRSQVARIERGELDAVPVGDIRAVAAALSAQIELRVRWHGEALDRLLDAAHAGLVERVVERLSRLGWECCVEVSFNVYGERGSIDVLASHRPSRTLLVVEVKSVVPDLQATLVTHDRKVRLAPGIARDRGWDVVNVGRLLVVADSSTARRRVENLGSTFATAYPARAVEVRRWLRAPAGPIAGLLFLPDDRGAVIVRAPRGRERVNLPRNHLISPG